MKIFNVTVLAVLLYSAIIAQNPGSVNNNVFLNPDAIITPPASVKSKILSGKLSFNISRKMSEYKADMAANSDEDIPVPYETVAIYLANSPSASQITELESLGVICYPGSWIPPLTNHPLGFFLARMPANKLNEVLSLAYVKKMDTSEYQNTPQNNFGAISINADDVWAMPGLYDGTGVKIAVLDSGIDTSFMGTELPAVFEKMDYSAYPASTDTDVANITSGHGTHVAGSVLARGYYSEGRTNDGNGSTAFKGMAPGADLVFLKIGGDVSSSSTGDAMIGAMQAAVNVYDADILTMSYGGWYAHHDGSSSVEQTADWVFSQGKPFFISAGNNGAARQHYSGTVAGNDSTDLIAVTAPESGTLTYNLVWFDGASRNNLYMNYYNSAEQKITTDIVQQETTESARGTESKYSYYNLFTSAGVYYLRVINDSPNSQDFHIYFDNYGYGITTFNNPDPFYTIGQPASADNAFAVGAYSSRANWISYDGTGPYAYNGANPLNDIAVFSSRGPRVNGGVLKPNICAPGTAIISLRDRDVYTSPGGSWIDDDGVTSAGDANYLVMQGTSMACPIAAGAAALLKQKEPAATAQNIYDAIVNTAASSAETGALPNNTWGNGKMDVAAALVSEELPVELTAFSASVNEGKVILNWQTETEINNYGFEIERVMITGQLLPVNEKWEKIGFIEGAGNSNIPKSYLFTDNSQIEERKRSYRLKQLDLDGKFTYSEEITVELSAIPAEFSLSQNYPNPFNPSTIIEFSLPNDSDVKLKVYNLLGQEVVSLIDGEMKAGYHKVKFDATSGLASGVYLYKIHAGEYSAVKKLMLLK